MENKQTVYRVFLLINLFINTVFCTLCPPLLLGFLGNYLCERFGWNSVVIALLVLLGVVIGFVSTVNYLRKSQSIQKQRSKREKESPYRIQHPRKEDTKNHANQS